MHKMPANAVRTSYSRDDSTPPLHRCSIHGTRPTNRRRRTMNSRISSNAHKAQGPQSHPNSTSTSRTDCNAAEPHRTLEISKFKTGIVLAYGLCKELETTNLDRSKFRTAVKLTSVHHVEIYQTMNFFIRSSPKKIKK